MPKHSFNLILVILFIQVSVSFGQDEFTSILTVNDFRLKSESFAKTCKENQTKLEAGFDQTEADDFKDIGAALQLCEQTKVLAEKLVEQGEPIGVHYFHVGEHYKSLYQEKWKSSSSSAKQRAMDWANGQVTKTAPKRARTLEQISVLYRKKSYEEAEELLQPMLQELGGFLPFLPQDRQSKLKRPFAGMANNIKIKTKEINVATTKQELSDRVQRLSVSMSAFMEAVEDAKQDFVQRALSATKAFGEPKLNPYQTITKILVTRSQLCRRLLSINGHEAILAGIQSDPGDSDRNPRDSVFPKQFENLNKYDVKIFQAIKAIGEFELNQLEGGRQEDFYMVLIKLIASYESSNSDFGFSRVSADKGFKVSDPKLIERVATYKKATSDVMYWRKRYVSDRLANTKTDVKTFTPQLNKLDRPIELKEEELTKQLRGKDFRIGFDSQLMFTNPNSANNNAYNRFQCDLLIDGGDSALTIEAARAAINAREQMWQSADTKIASIRFLSTPNRAAYLANAKRATSELEHGPLMIDSITPQFLLDYDKVYYEYFIESKNALKAFEQRENEEPENEEQKAESDSKEPTS